MSGIEKSAEKGEAVVSWVGVGWAGRASWGRQQVEEPQMRAESEEQYRGQKNP